MEDILVPLIVFGFIALVVKMALDFAKWKKVHDAGNELANGKADRSLGASELRMLIHEAVQDANQPLLERIEELENHVVRDDALLGEKAPLKQLAEPAPGDKE